MLTSYIEVPLIHFVLIEGKPIICGGHNYSDVSNKCYTFDGRIWTEAMSLMTTLGQFNYFPMAGHTSHPSWGFVMAGGGNDTADSVVTRDGLNMHVLPSLPGPVIFNCLLALDEHRLFSAGGSININITRNTSMKRVSFLIKR